MRILRIAICQIECHPALAPGTISYLDEPVVPKSTQGSLSWFGMKGLDVLPTQQACRAAYTAWHVARVEAVLARLEQQSPVADLVVFPEGSITVDLLPRLCEWSARHGVTIVGGTHTPLRTLQARRAYADCGLERPDLNRLFKYDSGNALPLIMNGVLELIPKRLSAPFERTVVSKAEPALPSLKPRDANLGEGSYSLLPLICSEALQEHNVAAPYEVVAIASYDARPSQFGPYLEQRRRQKKAAAYCNDGRYGGSMVCVVHDGRGDDFFGDFFPDGLPAGDVLLTVDVDLDVTAVEVGTAAPSANLRLVGLASIVGELSPEGAIAQQVPAVRSNETAEARVEALAELLRTGGLTKTQRVCLQHLQGLEKRGQPTEGWWDALGNDCIVTGQGSLRQVEGRLAATCVTEFQNLLTSPAAQDAAVAPAFMAFLSYCTELVKRGGSPSPVRPPADSVLTIINRSNEIRRVVEFIDDTHMVVLELTGLPQIGKSAVLRKALAQSGLTRVLRIPLSQTATVEYIAYAVLRHGDPGHPPYDDPVQLARSNAMVTALGEHDVIVLEDAHHLVERRDWRDTRTPDVLAGLVEAAGKARAKLIFETQHELPEFLSDPSVRTAQRIRGLDGKERTHAVALFDSQLRRVGLSPAAVDRGAKSTIVSKLGGHPVGIAIAADRTYAEGVEAVLGSLKQKKGFVLNFVRGLLRRLQLSDEERSVAQLLTLTRGDVPRETVLAAADFPAGPALSNLIALGVVEVLPSGLVQLAGVLREHFDASELGTELAQRFHEEAASAFRDRYERDREEVWAAIEAEFHAGLAGIDLKLATNLADGALATARRLYESQQYDRAGKLLDRLLRVRRTPDVMRLAALTDARRNRLPSAIALAKEVFAQNRRDTQLLTDLVKIALTQYQDDQIAEELLAIARKASVPDVSILIAEGRMALRQGDLQKAYDAFSRAVQLTERVAWPFYYLGIVYMRMGRVEDAIDVLHDGEEFCYSRNVRSQRAVNAIRTQLGIAYLYSDRIELAAQMIEGVFEDDPTSPEVIRAYAALTIKRDGIAEAHKALERLSEAKIRNRADRCQFHLLYGMFYLGIGEPQKASEEFTKAQAADRANVFVMMKQAKTLWELGLREWMDGDSGYEQTIDACARLVQRILAFDPDNRAGLELVQALEARFPDAIRDRR